MARTIGHGFNSAASAARIVLSVIQDSSNFMMETTMASHLFHEFSEDEREDAESIAASHGFDIVEFDICDEDQYPAGGAVGPIWRQVTVTRRSNGEVGIYDAGNSTAWHAGFERDLAAGEFGVSSV
ncbi:hypothetical protein [Paraburkholderia dipogonis]|uniref:hypothetical protein n=1 Tax=Paraburkholderia dipogonis TaxID=1211383 RepID=UPI0038BAEFC6